MWIVWVRNNEFIICNTLLFFLNPVVLSSISVNLTVQLFKLAELNQHYKGKRVLTRDDGFVGESSQEAELNTNIAQQIYIVIYKRPQSEI